MPARDEDILVLIHEFAHLMRVRFDQQARRHEMTRAQWTLLRRLEITPGLTQKQLAELIEIEPISVARLVDRLEAGGFVERRPDAADRRAWRVHLTPAAAPMLEEIGRVRAGMLEIALGDDVGPEALAATRATLLRMKANISAGERRVCDDRPGSSNAAGPDANGSST